MECIRRTDEVCPPHRAVQVEPASVLVKHCNWSFTNHVYLIYGGELLPPSQFLFLLWKRTALVPNTASEKTVVFWHATSFSCLEDLEFCPGATDLPVLSPHSLITY